MYAAYCLYICVDTLTDERQSGTGTRTLENSTRLFYSHLKNIWNGRWERFSSFFSFFLLFFPVFFCCCCCSFELFLPGNVHEIQELKCFSALIMLIIQHSRGLRRKDPWNVLLNLILISSLSFSLLSYENQSMKHLFCFSFYSLMSSVVEPIGLGLDMVSGLMHHMQ